MKKITDWTERLKRFTDNDTPFAEVKITDKVGRDHTARLYWTPKGIYGHQVRAFVWQTLASGETAVWTDVTNGYGYCKKSHMWTAIARTFGWNGDKDGEHFIPYRFHVGGNFYRMDLRTV